MPMAGSRHEIASMRSDLHRDNYRKILRTLIFLNGLTLFFIAIIIYTAFFQPRDTYYASTPQGLVIPLTTYR